MPPGLCRVDARCLKGGGHVGKDATDVHPQFLQGYQHGDQDQRQNNAVFSKAATFAGEEQLPYQVLSGFSGLSELA